MYNTLVEIDRLFHYLIYYLVQVSIRAILAPRAPVNSSSSSTTVNPTNAASQLTIQQ